MEVLQNMALLEELVQCGGPIFTWCYDKEGTLLHRLPSPWGPLWESCGPRPLKRKTET